MEFDNPIHIQQLEALKRRMPDKHPGRQRLESDLSMYYAGAYGERAVDYPLSEVLPENCLIRKGIRLASLNSTFFQMDYTLLTTRFFLLLEIKNYSGDLYFEPTSRQLIQKNTAGNKKYPCPILQVKRQANLFKKWMSDHNFPPIPVVSLVVLTNRHAVLHIPTNYTDAVEMVFHLDSLPFKIQSFFDQFHKELLPIKEVQYVYDLLGNQHQERLSDVLDQYKVNPELIKKGVHCPKCLSLPLMRSRTGWYCKLCEKSDRYAYLHALRDYYLLLGATITNAKFRNLTKIESVSIASRYLQKCGFESNGAFRNRIHTINYGKLLKMIREMDND